jgi:hypothetical protein
MVHTRAVRSRRTIGSKTTVVSERPTELPGRWLGSTVSASDTADAAEHVIGVILRNRGNIPVFGAAYVFFFGIGASFRGVLLFRCWQLQGPRHGGSIGHIVVLE